MVFLFFFLGALCLFVFAKIPVIAPGRWSVLVWISATVQLLLLPEATVSCLLQAFGYAKVGRLHFWSAAFYFNQGVGVLFISICIYSNRNALIILGKAELKPCIKDNKWRWTHLYSVNQSNSRSIELLKNRCELLCELDQGHFFQRASSKLFQERRASPDKYRMVCK